MSDKEEKKAHEAEKTIMELKIKKSRSKAAFTRNKNKLIEAIDDDESEESLLKELTDKLETAMDDCITVIEQLCQEYEHQGKTKEMSTTVTEIEQIELEYNKVMKQYHEPNEDDDSNNETTGDKSLVKDMHQQLKRVQIPVFTGDTRKYESWKAAFYACVDGTTTSAEYKLLQLRQYLSGEALKCIDNLGHSAASYEAAKERLERKYGGKRRQVIAFLEEIDRFPVMKDENAKSIEKFADLLDIVAINMKEAEKENDLKDGALYYRIQKKMPESMLRRYNRYVNENSCEESVDTMRHWLNKEAQFRMAASEITQGLAGTTSRHNTHFQAKSKPRNDRDICNRAIVICKMCSGNHEIYRCELFKQLSTEQRWDKAKQLELCVSVSW